MRSRNSVVSIVGLGYVGLCTAVCLASRGVRTIGVDADRRKLGLISKGKAPFHEPGLDEMLSRSLESGTFSCTSSLHDAQKSSSIMFVTVGTPASADGSADMSAIKAVSEDIGTSLIDDEQYHTIVVKSTVPPNTTLGLVKPTIESVSRKNCEQDFGLCSNPEFLKEGRALEDTLKPDRVVIGGAGPKSTEILAEFYQMFYGKECPTVVETSPTSAELIKYAANSFLAMKISFINSMANLCEELDEVDVRDVARGIGLDERIGPKFLNAGLGWGGSCFPKDLKAIQTFSRKEVGVDLPLIRATVEINDGQPHSAISLAKRLIGKLTRKRISLLGLAFKPDTDDMREAVSLKLIDALLREGARMAVHDPKATKNAGTIIGRKVDYFENVKDCLRGSDCCIIVTEWEEYKRLEPQDFKELMKTPAIVDGRRIYEPTKFKALKFAAIGLGRSNREGR